VSTPLDNKEQKPKHLQTKFKQPSIKQLDSTAAVSFFRGNHHYLWDKKTT
jgi:hypothetical protein